ncbi:VOC family protein [Bacillus massiliglaciei]|uniref:VOC family protein n=1 Tax=Bacillus massiliglaciei TaxID=1816693 RepID=UPI000B157921|nr:VOC family protein [Bacillus massiliglaciei]
MKHNASPIANKVNNVFIHVKDLQRSVNWYHELLGLSPVSEPVESPVYNIHVSGFTGLTLDDHTFDPLFVLKPSDHVLFNLYTENIDEAYDFINNKNVPIVKEIERIGEFAYFTFSDPDGNVLMICNH